MQKMGRRRAGKAVDRLALAKLSAHTGRAMCANSSMCWSGLRFWRAMSRAMTADDIDFGLAVN
jgi:hypothetical protein